MSAKNMEELPEQEKHGNCKKSGLITLIYIICDLSTHMCIMSYGYVYQQTCKQKTAKLFINLS